MLKSGLICRRFVWLFRFIRQYKSCTYVHLQIANAKDTDTLQDFLMDDNAGYITVSGFCKAVFKVTMNDIPEAVCTEFLIMKSISEISQFQEGPNVLGVSDLIKAHPCILHETFVHSDKEFTVFDLDELFPSYIFTSRKQC